MIGVNDIMRGKEVDEVYSNYKKIIDFSKKRCKDSYPINLYTGETKKLKTLIIKVEELNKRLEKFANSKIVLLLSI